jgi:hypothetical protein
VNEGECGGCIQYEKMKPVEVILRRERNEGE